MRLSHQSLSEITSLAEIEAIERAVTARANEIREQRDYELRQKVYRDDQALLAYCDRNIDRNAPVVRAETYGEREILTRQEIHFFLRHERDPRRPVIMRGAYYSLCEKHGGQRALWDAVLARYFRITRFTCLDRRSYDEVTTRLATGRRQYMRYFGSSTVVAHYPDDNYVWVEGVRVVVDDERLRSLRFIRQQIADIERKDARVRREIAGPRRRAKRAKAEFR